MNDDKMFGVEEKKEINYENDCCACGGPINFEFDERQTYLRFEDKNGLEKLLCNGCLGNVKTEMQWR